MQHETRSASGQRRVSLEALVELLRRPDVEVVAMAVPSAAGLAPIEPCGDVTFLAIEWHERALALRESALGAEHPKVAESLNNLGNAHWGRGELEIAADYLRRAASIKASAYGPDHFRVSSTLQNLGNVLYGQGRHAEAIDYWEQTLRIRDQALPAAHALHRFEAPRGYRTTALHVREPVP